MTAPGPPDPQATRRPAQQPRGTAVAPDDEQPSLSETSTGLWDDDYLPDWVVDASDDAPTPDGHRSNYIPATAPIAVVTELARQTAAPAGEADDGELSAEADERTGNSHDGVLAAAPVSTAPRSPATDPSPTTGPTRREARATVLLESDVTPARHLRARRAARIRVVFGLAAAAALLIGGAMAVTAAMTAQTPPTAGATLESEPTPVPLPQSVVAIPAPSSSAVPALVDVCADPQFVAAIGSADDSAALALAGGAEAFRTSVASGTATCIALDDPAHVWVLVNKAHPYDPIDYSPSSLTRPAGMREVGGGSVRTDAASALTAMAAAAQSAGVGEIALDSGFRSYGMQRSTYNGQVSANGREQADRVSARPGYSEHQSGLAADVTACAGGCVGLESFAGTAQQEWVAAHAWEFGWIVRYEDGYTDVTGYSPEPWHLRYIGPELAAAYHAGGWHTLEQFLGMPAAPEYAD